METEGINGSRCRFASHLAEGLLSRFVDIPILWPTDVGNETRANLARVSETDLHHNLGTTHISGLTSAQLALAWMLKKHDWIVPILGAIKSVYLYENLESTQLKLSAEQMRMLENAVNGIEIAGERYPAKEQRQVLGEERNPQIPLYGLAVIGSGPYGL